MFTHSFDLVTLDLPDPPPTLRETLRTASADGDHHRVTEILKTWPSTPDLTPKDLGSALNYAVSGGHLSIVQLLLDHGAPITTSTNAIATRDGTPNTLDIFKSFLRHGWSVDSTSGSIRGKETMTMNLVLLRRDSESLLQWFLANGAPANGIPSDPNPPLRTAAGSAPSLAVTRLLLSHGATLRHTSALHSATCSRSDGDDELSVAMMKLLLDEGIDIDELE